MTGAPPGVDIAALRARLEARRAETLAHSAETAGGARLAVDPTVDLCIACAR